MNLSNYYQYNRVCIFKCDFYVIRLLRLYKSIEINRNFVRFKNSKYKYINWELHHYHYMWEIEKNDLTDKVSLWSEIKKKHIYAL